jgi:hypothetical protein
MTQKIDIEWRVVMFLVYSTRDRFLNCSRSFGLLKSTETLIAINGLWLSISSVFRPARYKRRYTNFANFRVGVKLFSLVFSPIIKNVA